MSTSLNYSEIFCQAVESIVKGEVSKLEFDISKECTIIKINNKAQGKYQVSDGSISFEAVANGDVFYEVGDDVIVTIPKGDYNKQISILSKIVKESDTPAGWVRPFDTLMKCTGNLIPSKARTELCANGSVKSKNIVNLSTSYKGFTKIGLTAKFKTLLDSLNVIKGSYGLEIVLIDNNDNPTVFDLSNKDMFGNPYNFSVFSSQECVFDIPETLKNISAIEVNFYQSADFEDGNKNLIAADDKVSTLFVQDMGLYLGYDLLEAADEIVTISCDDLGYESPKGLNKEIVLTWHHKVDTYQMSPITQADIGDMSNYQIRWYRYTPGCKQDDYGGENWQLLNGSKTEDGKDDYDNLSSSQLKYTIKMRGVRTTERIKVICFVATHPFINDPDYTIWEQYNSNELKLENKTSDTSGGEDAQEVLKKNLSLKFDDESQGNYYLYDQNNELIDIKEKSKNRTLRLCYDGKFIGDQDVPLNITKIVWGYPNDTTMVNASEPSSTQQYDLSYTIKQRIYPTWTNNTISCSVYAEERLIATLSETLRFGQKGTNGTGNTFILEMVNNNAVIAGSETGLIIEAILIRDSGKRFYFTEAEANKIKWKLFYAPSKFTMNGEAVDSNGSIESIGKNWPTDKAEQWPKKSQVKLIYSEANVPQNNYAILEASYQLDSGGPELTTYLPIPVKSSNNYTGFSHGAAQILYNHQGIPKYSNDAYELQFSETKQASLNATHKPEGRFWTIEESLNKLDIGNYIAITFNGDVKLDKDTAETPCFMLQDASNTIYAVMADNKADILNLSSPTLWLKLTSDEYISITDNKRYTTLKIMPFTLELTQEAMNPNPVSLKMIRGEGEGLSAFPLYSKAEGNDNKIQDKVCVSCKLGSKVVWSQPILIMQTQYDFAMLNSWDGSLTIDEENGIILSTMLGAGKKNSQNQFSGVLIGDIQGGTDLQDTETMTGVYGFKDGVMTYGLKENGTAFFGAQNRGRIEFDGTSGIIRSAGWEKDGSNWKLPANKSGTLIDLDNARLNMSAEDGSFLKFNADAESAGKLQLKLNGADIVLTDQNNSLTSFVNVTANGITTELRKTAGYYATCATYKSLSGASGIDYTVGMLTFNNLTEGLTYDDLLQEGVTIAVTFNTVPSFATKIPTTDKHGNITGWSQEGLALGLGVGETWHPISFQGQNTGQNNPFVWGQDDTIYFTYRATTEDWAVVDSGSYSLIQQTANSIMSTVSAQDASNYSQITQTADAIKLEVARAASYQATCNTSKDTALKVIQLSNNDFISLGGNMSSGGGGGLASGCIILVTCNSDNNTTNNVKFKFVTKNSANKEITLNNREYDAVVTKWKSGDQIPFTYSGDKFIMTSIAQSSITQMADSIKAEVVSKNGENDEKSFSWSLTANAFILKNGKNGHYSEVFKCNSDGITIGGKGVIQSYNYVNSSGEDGMLIDLTNGSIQANDFSLSSQNVKITQDVMELTGRFQVSNDSIYLRTSNYKKESIDNVGPGYYYREVKCRHGNIYVRKFDTGKTFNNTRTTSNQIYQAECTADGTLIKEVVPGQPFSGYRIHYVNSSGVPIEGYVSVYYSGDPVFDTSYSKVVQGGFGSGVKYAGNALNLNEGILILNHGSKGYLVIGGNDAPIELYKSDGTRMSTLGTWINE